MPRKENTKARTWERDRRERMNAYFTTLGDLLPPHQDGRKRNKVDILIHAAKYIKDLHCRTEELFHAHASEVHKEELVRLKKLVAQLFSRTQLLSTLLKEAGISIPAEPAIEKVSAFKWSNKINVADSEKLFLKIEEKKRAKKKKERVVRHKVPSKRKNSLTPASAHNTRAKRSTGDDNTVKKNANNDDDAVEDQENRLNSVNGENKTSNDAAEADTAPRGSRINAPSTTGSSSSTETKTKTSSKRDANSGVEKLIDSKKKVKRKSKTNQKNKIINRRVGQSVANITSGTLILSTGGKIMPVVTPITPLTSNIIVNGQSQTTNPILLSNGQSNQMIVMQHLSNPVQNSVIPVCNQTLINAVQKVTLNPVQNIQTNIVVSSQDWVSNVKSIINATKITGRKCILPKGKDTTKTTMTYKVPILAVHKEKLDKPNETVNNNNRKDGDVKSKPNKNGIKGVKNQQNNAKQTKADEAPPTNNKNCNSLGNNNNNNDKDNDKETSGTVPPNSKRILNTDSTNDGEPESKKSKSVGDSLDSEKVENLLPDDDTTTSASKSIESLRNVVQKIGTDVGDVGIKKKGSNSGGGVESKKKLSATTSNNEKPNSPDSKVHDETSKARNDLGTEESGELLQSPNSNKEENAAVKSDLEKGKEEISTGELSNLNDAIGGTTFSEGMNIVGDSSSLVEGEKEEIPLSKAPPLPVNSSTTSATAAENRETNEASKEEAAISEGVKAVCNLGTRFDSLLQANVKRPMMVESVATLETSKIILNLDTNTTTTVKPETSAAAKPISSALLSEEDNLRGNKLGNFAKDEGLKSLSYSANNSFIPISRTEALHSDLSNDIFASLQVPSSSHHPESISPTAAFLMAFPLVSSLNGKTEVLEEEMKEDFKYRSQTPPMLLQIGAMEPNSFKLKSNASTTVSKDSLTTASHNDNPEMDKKNLLTQHVATQQTTTSGIPKYVKSAATTTTTMTTMTTMESNKEMENSSKISNDQSEIKNNQNLIASNVMQQKTNQQTIEVAVVKPMPKIIHTENLKEQYKIVQTSIPSSLTTPIEMNNTFSFTSATPTVSYSTTTAITSCAATQIQPTIAVHHNRPAAKVSSSAVESVSSLSGGINSSFQVSTESHHSIPASVSKYDLRAQYHSSSQNFMPNYPNISDNNIELPHYTPPTFTSSTIQKTSVQNSLNNNNNNNNNVSNISRLTSVASQASTQCHSVSKNPTSVQNLQQNYAVQSKDSHAVLNGNPNSKQQQSQDHRQDNYHGKKVETENFGQNFTFGKDNGVINSQNQSIAHGNNNPNISMFQEKSTTVQSYMPYSKDSKKIIGSMSSAPSSGKPVLNNVVHYPQNPMIVASNYEHSTVADNHNVKSTTTVAHNSSNFSILSWTTFSPVGGNNQNTNNNNNNNNNAMNYEQSQGGQVAPDTAENKTICENFGYVPLHKDNVGYSNMLPEFPNETGLNVNKLSNNNKPMLEAQKQPFIDQSKSQNIQTTIAQQKQNQNSSVDYKFNNENKAKAKYSIENNFMQSNYPNMEHQTKHQTIPTKQDKSNYPMPSYNPQVLFNMPESTPQLKYSTENYTGANFKYTEKPQQNQKYQPPPPPTQSHVPPALEQTNSVYKQSQNVGNKSKAQQIRAPVNWMMTPEIKHNTNISDIILPPIGKELEYCQNNLFTQNTSYNQGATNQFYNNYDATHSFPNIPVLQNEPKKVDTFYSEEQPFSWSPTKNTHIVEQSQSIKPIDQHIVPSTLPTLVGDLALGTNIPEKQNFLFGQMASSSRLPTEHNKDLIKEKDSNAGREYHAILNPQNGQQHAAQGTFLSVSQLVEHEKAEKSQQARKHQRKSTSPRGSGKRQLEIRKQAAGSDQLHHDDPKSSVQTFPEQNYQQKYQQNEAHWRNRNCKSNYTAEALIGTNTNVQEDNQQDKHASIKFAPNYGQNKFPGTLATDTMMPGINYFPNTDDGGNYGQTSNQNFNSYAYSSNANIYPTTNFITSISNTPSSYMMPLHENSDYLETNTFLLPNASSSSNAIKTHQHYVGKHQNCDKRSYSTAKRSKRKPDMAQNIEFPISGINSPLEDYHSSFLSHANLYQNHPPQTTNIYPKSVNTNLPGLPMTGNQNTIGSTGLPMNSNIPRGTSSNSPMVMAHPSGTSLTNFNLSTIFPEINDKVAGYKPPNSMLPGLTQPTGHGSNYTQRANYSNPLGHVPQVSEPAAQFTNNMPPSSSVHYKNS